MDGFNPLDLLASAAELQQKNDDGPERIIVTRQRRTAASSKPGLTVGQKENRELNKNNNNYISKGKPNVVIVKKLKKVEVNPELEKMLDEHNYGNAKRTVNHEHSYGNAKRTKSGDSVVEVHNHSRKRSESEKLHHSNTDPSVSSHKVTITGGQSKDKVTTVISNTNCSQLSDSECTVECSDKNTCSHTCVNRICLCSCKHETTDFKCSYIHEENVNDKRVNKTEKDFIDQLKYTTGIDQSGDNETKSCILKCDNGLAKKDKISGSLDQPANVEDNLKLDEHTGEFISKKGDSFSVKNIPSRDDECEDKMVPVIFDSTCVKNEPTSEVGPCLSADKDTTSSVVKNVSKSNIKKMPHVTVIPSDFNSESTIDNKSETLVINISGGHTADTLTKQVISNKQVKSTELVAESDGIKANVGIIRSLIINDFKNNNGESENKKKSVVLNLMSPKTTKLEMPHLNSHRLSVKADSYSSFKELEFSDSVCEEDSATSVHLLSPDRRNPDSMGIVESPVTQNVNEVSNSGKFEDSCGRSFDNFMETDDHVMPNCHDSCEKESNIKISKSETRTDHVESTSLFLNTTHSDSALEVELPVMESVSDSRELSESNLLPEERLANCDNSANSSVPPSTSGADIPIFRFDSDHCYAGIPRSEKTSPSRTENESTLPSESEEARTPLGSNSELSQDSGYEDVTQSPEIVQPAKLIEEEAVERTQNMKNLVPVLVSVNSNGSLTVHDTDLTKTLSRQVFLPDNMKVISGSNITPISQPSLILSPVAVAGKTSQVNLEVPKFVQPKPDGILELLSPKKTEIKSSAVDAPESPLTFGTFKIGTFASFSNTGMGLESPKKVAPVVKQVNEEKPKKVSPSSRSRSNSGKSGKSSPVVDTLGTLVQKVKSSLSPASSVDWSGIDHLQHDHDYCTKNLMPSVVSSFLEARLLSKDTPRSKVTHSKGKKSDMESLKSETKSSKRKKLSNSLSKEDFMDDVDIDSECDTHSIPEPAKQKYRGDKFIEPKRTDPKVKITGSSNFQDQFVYFMNTKKRSRRRESKDTPVASGSERVFIPPKPGDIIVPHLTDQDIENLKIRSKQSKQPSANAGYNSLRNEFMAAKLSNGTFSTTQSAETVDDEKNIINTILSLENEDLGSPVHSESSVYNESMEMYGQGLGSDIMNLLPEQMNLTQEQMDLLYSAVDEVQNSSPGLIGTDKLVSPEAANPAFQFPSLSSFVESNTSADSPQTTEDGIPEKKHETLKADEAEVSEKKDRDEESNEEKKDVKSDSSDNGDESVSVNDVKQGTEPLDNSISSNQNEEETKVIDRNEGSDITDEKVDDSVVSDVPSDETDKSIPLPPEHPCTPASTSSGCFSLATSVAPFDTFTSSVSVSDAVISTGPAGDACRDKPLFSTSSPSSGLVTQSSFSSDLSSVSSTPISSEIALPSIDKSLDLLGNIRFDRGDLFSEASVGGVSQTPASAVPAPSQVDYNAPWIVTVSMYWNDLPAIMINNQPFVRLVDIHKQILPAKDTGILKKRCQLMGIDVENCSEMQRYFLVQYGKAINSKSTLIISKDSAKILIGYYVEPQPKAARLDDHHKSIIDHRREQLRRIALARRAAVRAQRLSEKKDEPDPREIKDPVTENNLEMPPQKSPPEPTKRVEVPVVTSGSTIARNTSVDTSRSQRATRHKKINFLEMLRGDTTSQTTEDSEDYKKSNNKIQNDTSEIKKKNMMKDRKVKIVNYSVETDSSEETESVESDDYSSEYCDTDTTSEADSPIVAHQAKQHKVPQKLVTKIKSKVKPVPKSLSNKPPLKLKLGIKRPKPTATSTPTSVQLVNKSTGTTAQVYRSKMSNKLKNYEVLKSSIPSIIGQNVLKDSKMTMKGNFATTVSTCENSTSTGDSVSLDNVSEIVNSDMIIKSYRPEIADTHELKVSPTLPDDILQTVDSSDSHVSEVSESSDKNNENASRSIDENAISVKAIDGVESKFKVPDEQSSNVSVMSEIGLRSISPVHAGSSMSALKRKRVSHVGEEEMAVRIVHRDFSPVNQQRARSQLGEVFVNRYHNKKSMCVRCYTCRKMMSVDNFLRHLHDISGGLVNLSSPQTIDPSEADLSEQEVKLWESFQRKKELFDNNQLPSPDIMKHNIGYDESNSNGLVPDLGYVDDKVKKQDGPRIINTPVSPFKKEKVVRKNRMTGLSKSHTGTNQHNGIKKTPFTNIETPEGVRTSSRKRKVKHLDGFEDYSFSKFPRLMKNAVVEEENN